MSIVRPGSRVVRWLALCLLAAPVAAQQSTAGAVFATRESLRAELQRLDSAGAAGSRVAAALIRSRLEIGDFQLGDQILVQVDGEPQLSDTFTVAPGPTLDLPLVGAIALDGLLRSELQSRLQTQLGQYLRNPVVHVRPLIRIVVEGDVARPGFYAAAPQQPLSDVITAAGGLTQRAEPSRIRIVRGRENIWSGVPLQEALGRGYSLDQLNLRAGDRLLVPGRREGDRTWRIIGVLVSIPVAIYTITRIR